MSDQFFWFATRAAGIMTWFSATLSLCVGLMVSSRVFGRHPTIPWLVDVHRFTAAMSVVFLFLHMFTLWADSFVDFSLDDFLIPGRADAPGLTNLSIAWGVVAAWILVVVQASSLVKKYLPPDWWHTIHLLSFGVVISGVAHALQAGSDADNRVLVAIATSLLTAISLLLTTRILRVLLDRRYQYDRALDAEGVEGGRWHRDVVVDDYAPPPVAARLVAAPDPVEVGDKIRAEQVDVVDDYGDVDVDAYAYGDFSHPPPEEHEHEQVPGRQEGPGGEGTGGARSTPSVKEPPDGRWGGPGSFAASPPDGPTPPVRR